MEEEEEGEVMVPVDMICYSTKIINFILVICD